MCRCVSPQKTRVANARPAYGEYGRFARHLRYIDRTARRLARTSFHGMMVYQAKLERKQLFLFRLVDVVNELFAMSASIARAHALLKKGAPEAEHAAELADLFCYTSRRRIDEIFGRVWRNDDARKVATAKHVLAGEQRWMEASVEGLEHLAAGEDAAAQASK